MFYHQYPWRVSGGGLNMTHSRRPLQAHMPTWSPTCLQDQWAFLLQSGISPASCLSYLSTLWSYQEFCLSQGFPEDPTVDTLSLYLAFKSPSVKPQTLSSYLSAICSKLELYYPSIRDAQRSHLVCKTLAGAHHVYGTPTCHKDPLLPSHLTCLILLYDSSSHFDDLLFLTLILVGFDQLLHLVELCSPDNDHLFDSHKIMKHFEVSISIHTIWLLLPSHKADKFFTGSTLLICNSNTSISPFPFLLCYIQKCDALFLWLPALWLQSDGSPPTCSWFLCHLHQHFPSSISGHSMRTGGATALAAAGIPNDHIWILGHWSFNAYQVYLCSHSHIVHACTSPTISL